MRTEPTAAAKSRGGHCASSAAPRAVPAASDPAETCCAGRKRGEQRRNRRDWRQGCPRRSDRRRRRRDASASGRSSARDKGSPAPADRQARRRREFRPCAPRTGPPCPAKHGSAIAPDAMTRASEAASGTCRRAGDRGIFAPAHETRGGDRTSLDIDIGQRVVGRIEPADAQARRHQDHPGAGRDDREWRLARGRDAAAATRWNHGRRRARRRHAPSPAAAAISGLIGARRSIGRAQRRHQADRRPSAETTLESRPSQRRPQIGMRAQRRDLGRRDAASRHAQYCG